MAGSESAQEPKYAAGACSCALRRPGPNPDVGEVWLGWQSRGHCATRVPNTGFAGIEPDPRVCEEAVLQTGMQGRDSVGLARDIGVVEEGAHMLTGRPLRGQERRQASKEPA